MTTGSCSRAATFSGTASRHRTGRHPARPYFTLTDPGGAVHQVQDFLAINAC
jgi:phage gpG-like protein